MHATRQDSMIMPTTSSSPTPTRIANMRSGGAMSTEEIKARIEAMFAVEDADASPALVD
ncbi:hypothetical protein [Rhodococcus tibetensis]|uniref:Uncharacterized protein n=1 Tax=Rhodococcus tibetensis TaxID=2965064 RepID=A0ABT1Q6D2_9NOCA|nr:hypothetical protein [Rhodococcus sp. FXJ9.536]MCQ4117813.1 hypothetical protein [Rhodococcus sp. FXJ9.536]